MRTIPAPTRAKRPVPVLRLALAALALVAGLAAALALALSVFLFSDWGHEHVARRIERAINAEMMGTLRIGGIDRIELPYVEAHDVQLVPPDDAPAIDVKQVRLELDFAALREGRFAWKHADIHGGVVRVTEDAKGRVNMEELFRARHPSPRLSRSKNPDYSPLDLRTMVTSDMTLLIHGGDMPKLRLERLHGIMRVQQLPNDQVTLRFDEYRGVMRGLPTGKLDFREVKGHVTTDQNRLLRFEGRGRSDGEPVEFTLDIQRRPKKHVKIDARFPRLSRESISTLGFSAYTKFQKDLEVNVQPGELEARAARRGQGIQRRATQRPWRQGQRGRGRGPDWV